jgi:N-formylglutamate amidohydrolase
LNGLTIPLIAHIPHSNTAIPVDLRTSFKLNDAELESEIFQLTDWCVDELFSSVEEMGGDATKIPCGPIAVSVLTRFAQHRL